MRTWCVPAGIGASASIVEALQAEQVVAVPRPAVLRVEAPAGEGAALGDDHALGARLGHVHLGRHGVRLVLDVEHRRSRSAGPSRRRAAGSCPCTSVGRPARSGLKRSTRRSSSGSTLYFRASVEPELLQLGELLGHLGREVVRLAPVRVRVVELPDVVVEGRQLGAITQGVEWRVTAVQPSW